MHWTTEDMEAVPQVLARLRAAGQEVVAVVPYRIDKDTGQVINVRIFSADKKG